MPSADRPDPAVTVRPATAMDHVELQALARRVGDEVPAAPVVVAADHERVVGGRSARTGVTILAPDVTPGARRALRRGR